MNDRLRGSRATIDSRDDAATALETRFAQRIVACLAEQTEATTHDVTERLRFARTQALERARVARLAPSMPLAEPLGARGFAVASAGGARLPSQREPSAWWVRLATALPLAALLGGLLLIQQQHVSEQVAAAAEIDADLLTDSLPPSAYGDAAFVEFLKAPQN